jgi:predicted dehydrogenase
MRMGVVGCGYWGARHLRVLHQIGDVDQVVAIDERPEALALAQGAFPGIRSFDGLTGALPNVDAVIIATPPSTHHVLAATAMRAGKHVLVEKPMATSTAAAEKMIEQASAASVTLMVGHTFEYSDAVEKLHEIVNSGDLGTIQYIDSARLNLGIYQSDVNVLWDLAPHDLSIINHLLGVLPSSVQAWGSCHADPTVEDVGYLNLHYPDSNVTAVVAVSWLSPCKVRRVTVVGSKKMAVYDDMADQEPVRVYDKGVTRATPVENFPARPISYRYGDIVSPYVHIREPLVRQDQHFIDCIRWGTKPQSDGGSGLAVSRVLEAASIALQSNAEIGIESFRPVRSRRAPSVELQAVGGGRR